MKSKLLLLVISLATVVPNAYCKDVVLALQAASPPAVPDRSQGVQSLFSPRNIAMAAGAACCVGGLLFYRYRGRERAERTGALHGFCQWVASFFSSRTRVKTPLMQAAENGNENDMRALLDAGEYCGMTALMHAAQSGHVEAMRVLLDAGAEVSAATEYYGKTALMYAAQSGHVEAMKVLLDAGAKVNATSNLGCTLLMYAAQSGHGEIVQLLLDAGAKVNATSNLGCTPLMYAAQSDHGEIVQLLLDAGAKVNATSNLGCTPLMYAAQSGHVEVMRVLLDAGANMDAADRYGKTPLLLAAVGRAEKVVKELLLRGAVFPTERVMAKVRLSERARLILERNKKYSDQYRVAAIGALEELPRDLGNIVLSQIGHQKMSGQELQKLEQSL